MIDQIEIIRKVAKSPCKSQPCILAFLHHFWGLWLQLEIIWLIFNVQVRSNFPRHHIVTSDRHRERWHFQVKKYRPAQIIIHNFSKLDLQYLYVWNVSMRELSYMYNYAEKLMKISLCINDRKIISTSNVISRLNILRPSQEKPCFSAPPAPFFFEVLQFSFYFVNKLSSEIY